MAEYARPEMLVSSEWLAQHLHEPGLRIVEVDVDTSAYEQGHIPGAVGWNWQTQLCDQVRRDILTKEQFERLMGESGIDPAGPTPLGLPPVPHGSDAATHGHRLGRGIAADTTLTRLSPPGAGAS